MYFSSTAADALARRRPARELLRRGQLADTQDIGAHGASVWIAKQARRRSLTADLAFDGRQLLTPDERCRPACGSAVADVAAAWRHHRFTLRTWAVVGAANPLRVYRCRTAGRTSSPSRTCFQLTCTATAAPTCGRRRHARRRTPTACCAPTTILRQAVGVPRGAERADYWRRRVTLEDAARLLRRWARARRLRGDARRQRPRDPRRPAPRVDHRRRRQAAPPRRRPPARSPPTSCRSRRRTPPTRSGSSASAATSARGTFLLPSTPSAPRTRARSAGRRAAGRRRRGAPRRRLRARFLRRPRAAAPTPLFTPPTTVDATAAPPPLARFDGCRPPPA